MSNSDENSKLTLTKYHHLMQMKRCQVFDFTRKTKESEEFVTTTSNDHIKAKSVNHFY